jgi:hypothetical protein
MRLKVTRPGPGSATTTEYGDESLANMDKLVRYLEMLDRHDVRSGLQPSGILQIGYSRVMRAGITYELVER